MDNSLESLVLQKEQEWKDAFQLRVKNLEENLAEKGKELKKEKLRFRKLKEDFEYNLKLIEERDEELDKYEVVFSKVKGTECSQAAELSELSVKIDELKIKLENEKQAKETLQKHYQKRLKDYQTEMNIFRSQKENEINKEREELASFRRNLESQLRAAEDDYEFRRQELIGNFDEEMRKREQEYQGKLDETSSLLLANDLKVRTLVKELELVRSASGHRQEQLDQRESSSRELEKELKEKDWIISDLKNTHNFKIADMQAQIDNINNIHKKIQDDFTRKHGEQDRMIREREEMLTSSKQGFAEQERQLVEKTRELHSALEKKDQEYRQKEWRFIDKLKEQDITIQNLQETIADLQNKLEFQTSENARLTVTKDVELEALQQQEGKLRSGLAQRKDEVARFQKDLTLSLEREASMERSKAQLELDWQRRCEDAEMTGYEKQEELVKSLTQSKNEAYSLINEQKRELSHKDSLVRILTQQRLEAVATLQRHGLSIPVQLPTKDTRDNVQDFNTESDDERMKDLQSQNEKLLQVIHLMRQDVENLTSQPSAQESNIPEKMTTNRQAPLTSEYVDSLEKEIRDLKARNRDLNQRVSEQESLKAEPRTLLSNKPNDIYVMAHVKELNDTIGALRQEKLEITSQLRKYEATVVHLQGMISRSEEQMRQKQTTIDKLKYQLTTVSRRAEDELTQWKQRDSDLNLQLTQARHEADEFYKNSLERNIDAVSLGNQLSSLKLDLANEGKHGSTSYNPHLDIIRQLQDEVQILRSQLNKDVISEEVVHSSGKTTILQDKLRDAAKRISVLLKEKDQLIKIGNKLRAEIMKLKKGEDTSFNPTDEARRKRSESRSPTSKLRALEELQYQLTARELQVSNRAVVPRSQPPGDDVIETTRDTHAPASRTHEPHVFQESSSPRDNVQTPWLPSFSSDEHSSLKEVWKLLDEESPGMTPRETRVEHEVSAHMVSNNTPCQTSSGSFTVKGRHSNLSTKQSARAQKPALSAKAAGKLMPAVQQKIKVRNYNVKDNAFPRNVK